MWSGVGFYVLWVINLNQMKWSLDALVGFTSFDCSLRGGWECVWQHATEQTTPSWPPSCLASNHTLRILTWKSWCLVHISSMTMGKNNHYNSSLWKSLLPITVKLCLKNSATVILSGLFLQDSFVSSSGVFLLSTPQEHFPHDRAGWLWHRLQAPHHRERRGWGSHGGERRAGTGETPWCPAEAAPWHPDHPWWPLRCTRPGDCCSTDEH